MAKLAMVGSCLVCASVLGACSGATDEGNKSQTGGNGGTVSTTGGSSSSGAGGAGAATGGGKNPSGGSSSSGGKSSSGGGTASGGSVALTCKGDFSARREHFRLAELSELASPTVSPDDLELLYADGDTALTNWHFRRSLRATKTEVFQPGEIVSELDAACAPELRRAQAFSADALRLYFICYTKVGDVSDLRVARRPGRGQPFVIDSTKYGSVGTSPAVSHDELEIYATGTDPNVANSSVMVRYQRSSQSSAFGDAQPIPGLETVLGSTPVLSPDGLELLFFLSAGISAAYRNSPSEAFGAVINFPNLKTDASVALGSPEVSQDCRTLYFINVERSSGTASVFSLASATR